MVANKQVLDSAIESVPHMEGSCDVRRRNDHGVGVTSSVKSCLKCRPIEPPLHNALLSSARGISSPLPQRLLLVIQPGFYRHTRPVDERDVTIPPTGPRRARHEGPSPTHLRTCGRLL